MKRMKRRFLRILPERAAAQIALIVVSSLVLANVVTAVVLLLMLPSEFRKIPNFPYVVQLVALARQMEAAPTSQARTIVLDAALASNPQLSRLEGKVPRADPNNRFDEDILRGSASDLRDIADVFFITRSERVPGPPPLALRFKDGTGLVMAPPPMTPPPRGLAFIIFLIAMVVSLVSLIGLLSLWAARAMASPLSQLAAAADRFDPDRGDPVQLERGPVEVRRLAGAFNAMSERIRRLVDERTRMLAAVSHDLRTPITRLRLRAEELPDEDKRRAILSDLALMERMVSGALSYLREGRASGSMAATDIPALLQTICDDFGDLGHIVVYDGPIRASALCDADQMMRAVTNLVDNAIKFGGKAQVRLDDGDAQRIAVIVEDDGPGIAPDEREKVFEPFYRSDVARTLREGSGFGLGLAIVRSIAEAHRGELALAERPGGGLKATISWPRRW